MVRLTQEAMETAGIELVAASRANFRPSVAAAGIVQPDARLKVVVRAPGAGRVLRVAVDVGTRLARGALVAVIESADASGALSRHRAAAAREEAARGALGRAERLLGLEAISRAERDTRRAEAEAAAADATAARQDLARLGLDPAREDGQLRIRTPHSGTVLEVAAVEGGLVEKDAPLAAVADLSDVWALLETPDAAAARIEKGVTVEVRCDALPERAFPGRVALAEPALGEAAGRVRVRVVLDNAEGVLRPGLFVSADLPLPGPGSEGTAVPSEAIQRLSGMTAVFVETAPGEFEVRPVETGRESAHSVELRQGLRDGERVVARGAFVLKSELLKSSLAAEEEKE